MPSHRLKQAGMKDSRTPRSQCFSDRPPFIEPLRAALFEDCPTLFQFYASALSNIGLTSLVNRAPLVFDTPAAAVAEAIRIVRAYTPELVITDLSLTSGGEEGFEILRLVKAISPNTGVVLSTSIYDPRATDEENLKIRAAGFDCVFQKGELERLMDYVSRVAEEQPLRR